MPRVGSSKMRMSQFFSNHFAMTTFCWLPPDRFLVVCRIDGLLIRSESTYDFERFRIARSCMNPYLAKSGIELTVMLALTSCSSSRPNCLRSSDRTPIRCRAPSPPRRGPHRVPGPSRRAGDRAPPAAQPDRAAVGLVRADERTCHLGPAGAHQPGEPENLALAQLERHVLEQRLGAQPADLEQYLAVVTDADRHGLAGDG